MNKKVLIEEHQFVEANNGSLAAVISDYKNILDFEMPSENLDFKPVFTTQEKTTQTL
jgi:hypothetical protein